MLSARRSPRPARSTRRRTCRRSPRTPAAAFPASSSASTELRREPGPARRDAARLASHRARCSGGLRGSTSSTTRSRCPCRGSTSRAGHAARRPASRPPAAVRPRRAALPPACVRPCLPPGRPRARPERVRPRAGRRPASGSIPHRVRVCPHGVDHDAFRPGDASARAVPPLSREDVAAQEPRATARGVRTAARGGSPACVSCSPAAGTEKLGRARRRRGTRARPGRRSWSSSTAAPRASSSRACTRASEQPVLEAMACGDPGRGSAGRLAAGGVRRRGRPLRPARPGGDRGGRRGTPSPGPRSCAPPGSRTRPASPGRQRPGSHAEAYRAASTR